MPFIKFIERVSPLFRPCRHTFSHCHPRLYPFDLFYDVRVASQLVPTLPLMEWKQRCNSTFELDIYPQRNQKIVQKKVLPMLLILKV